MRANCEKPSIRNRIYRALKFVKLLRIEPYFFLVVIQNALKGTPNTQLVQDKICRFWYNQTETFCYDLPSKKDVGENSLKSQILIDAAQFATYSTYLSTIPALLWALFVGAWIDRYLKGRKIVILVTCSAAILENFFIIFLSINFKTSVYYNLLAQIPTSFTGGILVYKIAINHYITSTTPPRLRAIRFMIYELCLFTASPIGSAVGGYLLVQKPMFHFGEIRNYSLCFILCLGLDISALIWVLLMVNESKAKKQGIKMQMKLKGITVCDNKDKVKEELEKKAVETQHPLKLLFDFKNVKDMMMCCIKERPNKVRAQIWLIFLAVFSNLVAVGGQHHIAPQYVQKLYYWTPDWQSYINSINMIIHTIATLTIVPFLIKVLKVADLPLAIIGYSTYFCQMAIRGFKPLIELVYYASVPVGALSGVSNIGVRSYMSKIIDSNEIGKVFSLMTAIDTTAPLIANTLYTIVFKKTINSYPGAMFQISAFIILFPILIVMWIDLFTIRPTDNKRRQRHRTNLKEDNNNNNNNNDNNDNSVLHETKIQFDNKRLAH